MSQKDCGCPSVPKECEREHRVVGPINKDTTKWRLFACIRCGAKFLILGFPTVEEFSKMVDEITDV